MFDAVVLGTVVTDDGVTPGAYVAIAGEKIAEVGRGTPPAARTTFDRSGSLIFPGLVDGHVHTGSALGWPGIEGTTKTAAAGGVTTCVDMPYDVPEATTISSGARSAL
jgi:allantoinase